MTRFGLLLVLLALPAAAKVARPEARRQMHMATATVLPDLYRSLKAAPAPRRQQDRLAPILDGVTVLELNHDATSAPRRLVFKPEFARGPCAAFAVNF